MKAKLIKVLLFSALAPLLGSANLVHGDAQGVVGSYGYKFENGDSASKESIEAFRESTKNVEVYKLFSIQIGLIFLRIDAIAAEIDSIRKNVVENSAVISFPQQQDKDEINNIYEEFEEQHKLAKDEMQKSTQRSLSPDQLRDILTNLQRILNNIKQIEAIYIQAADKFSNNEATKWSIRQNLKPYERGYDRLNRVVPAT